MPTPIKAPKRSRAPAATFRISINQKENNPTASTLPANPHSSAQTGKTKSVCCSGRKLELGLGALAVALAARLTRTHRYHRLARMVALS